MVGTAIRRCPTAGRCSLHLESTAEYVTVQMGETRTQEGDLDMENDYSSCG